MSSPTNSRGWRRSTVGSSTSSTPGARRGWGLRRSACRPAVVLNAIHDTGNVFYGDIARIAQQHLDTVIGRLQAELASSKRTPELIYRLTSPLYWLSLIGRGLVWLWGSNRRRIAAVIGALAGCLGPARGCRSSTRLLRDFLDPSAKRSDDDVPSASAASRRTSRGIGPAMVGGFSAEDAGASVGRAARSRHRTRRIARAIRAPRTARRRDGTRSR